MRRYLIVMLILPFMSVDALYCKNADIALQKTVASNISYIYDYMEIDSNVTFNIKLYNLTQNMYIVDNNDVVYSDFDSELSFDGYRSGNSASFKIYMQGGECDGTYLTTILIQLPVYNKFYSNAVCDDVPNYYLCNKWGSVGMDESSFIAKVNEYKLSLENDSLEDYGELSIWEILIEYVSKYYYIGLIGVILLVSVGFYFSNRKNNIYR